MCCFRWIFIRLSLFSCGFLNFGLFFLLSFLLYWILYSFLDLGFLNSLFNFCFLNNFFNLGLLHSFLLGLG